MAAVAPEGDKNSEPAKKGSLDLTRMPELSFGDVELFAKKTGGGSTSLKKAYKFFAETGYLHDYKVRYSQEEATIESKCFRSMKKSEKPHSVFIVCLLENKNLYGKCSCVAGAGGACQHTLALLLLIAHCKQLGLTALPDELTCTMSAQRWNIPRGKKITPECVDQVVVKKTREGADYTKSIKSSLYSPASQYLLLDSTFKENLKALEPVPLICTLLPDMSDTNLPAISTRFGKVPIGCILSYQQKLTSSYIINDYANTDFPSLPLTSNTSFTNNFSSCLNAEQSATLTSLRVDEEMSFHLEERTRDQSECQLWHTLRKKRITASKFGIVAKRQANFKSLCKQLDPTRHVQTAAMKKGIEMEPYAAYNYATKVKNSSVNLYPCGLVIHPVCPWLGCSPDRKVFDMELATENAMSPFGLLEIKVVCKDVESLHDVNYLTFDKDTNHFALKRKHEFFYQIQCQLAITCLQWCDFFCFVSSDLYFHERILFDRNFFQESKDRVDTFYFTYYIT